MLYNWQQPDWPNFTYSLDGMESELIRFAEHIGKISGTVWALPENDKMEIIVSSMVMEAIKTSEIEGEYMSRQDVVSSIQNNLGLKSNSDKIGDKRASGISELISDISQTFAEPLSIEKLFSWHRMLMKGNRYINAGAWRRDEAPMQVVSGTVGKEKVHFEAPLSKQVPVEMDAFVAWFNSSSPTGKEPILHAPVRAAIAHLYFESIHPFEDGNGRIGRAISEKVISQHAGTPIPISLSQTIEANKKRYYKALETAQRSNEITKWIKYFISVTRNSQDNAHSLIEFVLKKARFFDRFQNQMNPRQLKVVRKMLELGVDGFEGGMTAKKYISIAKTSKPTATRDLKDLSDKGIVLSTGGGRSVRYEVNT